MAKPYVRIEQKGKRDPGDFSVVTYDRIIAVDENGIESEISSTVLEWRVTSKPGEIRRLTLEIGPFVVENEHRG